MNKKVLVIVVVLMFVVMGAAIAGTVFFLKSSMSVAAPMSADGVAVEVVPAPVTAIATPIYKTLEPAFVVNIDDGRTVRFLQVKVDVMARSQSVLNEIDVFEPRIRNDIIMFFSTLNREMVRDHAQREQLQSQVLNIINSVLAESGRRGVEAVYFTSFVVQ